MEKINSRLTLLFSVAWLIYLLYSIVQSFVDYQSMKRVDWEHAENISSTFTGYKASIITRAYKKDKTSIRRDYGFFGQGVNMALSGVDKSDRLTSISFYVKSADYDLINDQHAVIPYFGLRTLNKSAGSVFVILDLWKFNYSKTIAFIVMFFPLLFVFLIAKIKKKENFKIEELDVDSKIINYLYLAFIICLLINFVL